MAKIKCLSCGSKFYGDGLSAKYKICYPCYEASDHANAVAFRQVVPISEARESWTINDVPVKGSGINWAEILLKQ